MPHRNHGKYGSGPQEARPLKWSDLVPGEQGLLRRIHGCLKDICGAARPSNDPSQACSDEPWADIASDPRGRIMVISGDRGSGKTTILVTLLNQLNQQRRDALDPTVSDIVAAGVRPLAVLDFDPLPNGVPLHAWLIQAWLPLVQNLETTTPRSHSDQMQCAPLREAWDSLFEQAVTAWTDVHDGRAAIDRLFDHRDQLRNYQELVRGWQKFVDDVFERLNHTDREATLILIPIDDVDLQVKRNIELIHAMRLLRHPRVLYLLTADLVHTEDVIFFDFCRQHYDVGGTIALQATRDVEMHCRNLTRALLEKAYPETHVFRTDPISISTLLAWRNGVLQSILNALTVDGVKLGEWLSNRAPSANESFMRWRGVQRILDQVNTMQSDDQQRATLVLRLILAQGDAVKRVSAINEKGHGAVVDFGLTGEIRIGSIPAWFTGVRNNRIVVGTELSNFFTGSDGQVLDAPTALLARELHEETEDPETGIPKSGTGRRGPVQADGIIVSIGTVLAWTRWTNAPRNAVFLWPFARFPRISTLRGWLRDWKAQTDVIRDSRDPDEKLAYAWIWCQIHWCKSTTPDLPNFKEPLEKTHWTSLLSTLETGMTVNRDLGYWYKQLVHAPRSSSGVPGAAIAESFGA